MEVSEISAADAYKAYRKLKSMAYYDSVNLTLKRRIAEFEAEFMQNLKDNTAEQEIEQTFSDIAKVANDSEKHKDKLDKWLRALKVITIPKNFRYWDQPVDTDGFISNIVPSEPICVDSLNCLCDAPVELMVLSVLWVMTVGRRIDEKLGVSDLYKKVCYANRLFYKNHDLEYRWAERDDNESNKEDVEGLLLFEPYYQGYSDWRDLAIDEAVKLLDDKKNASIVSFDIRRFFYSVRLDVRKVFNEKVKPESDLENNLTQIIHKIHIRYAEEAKKKLPYEFGDIKDESCYLPLPVGLPSSGILANWHLHEWDRQVIEKLHPQYYGRYVDDILMVFADRKTDLYKNGNQTKERDYLGNFINNVFETAGLLKKAEGENVSEVEFELIIEKENQQNGIQRSPLKLQKKKIILQHFDHKETKAAILKFKKKIDERRSEFRYLPEEEKTDNAFEDSAYNLQFSDSVNKLRGVKKLSVDRFGASIYLTRKLMLAQSFDYDSSQTKELHDTTNQILTFFKGQRNIEMMSLWEKVATYFIITKQPDALTRFLLQTLSDIQNLRVDDALALCKEDREIVEQNLRENLKDTLMISVALPIAVNPVFLSFVRHAKVDTELIRNYADLLRKSLMFRFNWQKLPAKCLLLDSEDKPANLFESSLPAKSQYNERAKWILPVFIKFQEFNILEIFRSLKNGTVEDGSQLKSAWEYFLYFNYSWRKSPWRPKPFFYDGNATDRNDNSDNPTEPLRYIGTKELNTAAKIEKNKISPLVVGIANWKVNETDLDSLLHRRSNDNTIRRDHLFEIINEAVRCKVDLLVFPELSLPLEWVPILSRKSADAGMAIVAGLEYYVCDDGKVINSVVTILPSLQNKIKSALVKIRVKNYYAPAEIDNIENHGLIPYVVKDSQYDLFHWKSSYFSVYNCFELSNITDRALLKSKVDFLVAVEFNADINYYSNIVGSWARDLHSYVVQVNTSQYGDSRIVCPKKSELANLLQIKGGRYPVLLVEQIDIDALRQFQYHKYMGHAHNGKFKPVPANYDRQWLNRRINDDL